MPAKQSPRSRLQGERPFAPIYHTRHRCPEEHYPGEATVASYGPKIPCRCNPIFPKLHPTPWLCEVERVPMYPTPSLHAPTDTGPPTPPTSPGLQGKCWKLHLEGIVWRPHQTHKQTRRALLLKMRRALPAVMLTLVQVRCWAGKQWC